MKLFVISAAILGTVVAGGSGASAGSAEDTTPPTLKAPVKASFTVGGQLSPGNVPDCSDDPGDIWAGLPSNFKWRGADDSGYVRYDLVENTGYDGASEVFTGSSQASYATWSENSSQACGGGNHTVYEWNLTATDAAGNSTTVDVYGGRMRLTQDNNLTDTNGYAPGAVLAYSGSWQLSSCQCWSQGGTHKTTSAGASATVRLGSATDGRPFHVGLVMHTGPDRGKVAVYVNGRLASIVDTYAAASRPRVMVWQRAFTDPSTRIRIVNQATPGRKRIDLDAVVVN